MQNFFFDRITDIIIVSASLVLEPLYLFHAVTKQPKEGFVPQLEPNLSE